MSVRFEAVAWATCVAGSWCNFETVKMSTLDDDDLGVYVIWHDGSSSARGPECVRVGHGEIRNRILAHRNDILILSYNFFGELKVMWALVPDAGTRLGIERYLADQLKPKVGEYRGDVDPIGVDLPSSLRLTSPAPSP